MKLDDSKIAANNLFLMTLSLSHTMKCRLGFLMSFTGETFVSDLYGYFLRDFVSLAKRQRGLACPYKTVKFFQSSYARAASTGRPVIRLLWLLDFGSL